MHIKPGDGFELTNGNLVRVSSVFDVYDTFNTETRTGDGATAYVRYSRHWIDSQLVFSQQETLDEFIDRVESRVPDDELPAEKRPGEP
jgi:hypothetical protein